MRGNNTCTVPPFVAAGLLHRRRLQGEAGSVVSVPRRVLRRHGCAAPPLSRPVRDGHIRRRRRRCRWQRQRLTAANAETHESSKQVHVTYTLFRRRVYSEKLHTRHRVLLRKQPRQSSSNSSNACGSSVNSHTCQSYACTNTQIMKPQNSAHTRARMHGWMRPYASSIILSLPTVTVDAMCVRRTLGLCQWYSSTYYSSSTTT